MLFVFQILKIENKLLYKKFKVFILNQHESESDQHWENNG